MQKKGANRCRAQAEELQYLSLRTGTFYQHPEAFMGDGTGGRLSTEQQPKLGIRSLHQPATLKLYALPVPDLGCA